MNIIYNDNTLDLTNLKRKPEVEAEYQSLLKVIKNAGSTPEEVILNKMDCYVLKKVLNEFPYDLPENMEHWIVWNRSGEETLFLEGLYFFHVGIESQRGNFYLKKDSIVAIFENTPDKKSVGLKHYHLILRKYV
jgi:hypothetical protein